MKSIDGGAFPALSSIQVIFILSIKNINPTLTGDASCELIAEMFSPRQLFSREILALTSKHLGLRKFLNSRGAALQQYFSRRIIQTFAHGLSSVAEYGETAIQKVLLHISHGRRVRNELEAGSQRMHSTESQNDQHVPLSVERVAHSIALRIKDMDNKFDGNLGKRRSK